MKKFKIGDIVIGNRGANCYGITNEGSISIVREVDGSTIGVVPLKEYNGDYCEFDNAKLMGERFYNVYGEYFDILYSVGKKKIKLFD